MARGVEGAKMAPVWMQDKPLSNLVDLRGKVRRLKHQAVRAGVELGMIVLDYLQLVEGQKGQDEYARISEVSRALKVLAQEERIVIVALSQLNRSLESRGNKR